MNRFNNNTNNNNQVLQRVLLSNLDPSISNSVIIGIIIANQEPKKFIDPNNDSYKAVWNFTFRGSSQDFINVTYWDKADTIMKIYMKFNIGDVIEISRPQILIRNSNDQGENYRPMVTSPYKLVLYDFSNIVHYEGADKHKYLKLLNLPTKPMGFIPLRDIQKEGMEMKNKFADILAALAFVGETRKVKMKSGNEVEVRDIILFDQTHPSLRISLWNQEYINRASNWIPRSTTFFIADLKFEWSTFHNAVIGVISGRTIITENPEGINFNGLKTYALSAPLQSYAMAEHFISNMLPDVNMITNVMSVRQIQNNIHLNRDDGAENRQFSGIIFAVVTQFDLDGPFQVIRKKCGYCKELMRTASCINRACPVAQNAESADPILSFDIRMSLSDHTGTLSNCKLTGQTAETVLGCSVSQFSNMCDDFKGKMKWKYLLERCSVKFVVFLMPKREPTITILSVENANPIEVSQRISVY